MGSKGKEMKEMEMPLEFQEELIRNYERRKGNDLSDAIRINTGEHVPTGNGNHTHRPDGR